MPGEMAQKPRFRKPKPYDAACSWKCYIRFPKAVSLDDMVRVYDLAKGGYMMVEGTR